MNINKNIWHGGVEARHLLTQAQAPLALDMFKGCPRFRYLHFNLVTNSFNTYSTLFIVVIQRLLNTHSGLGFPVSVWVQSVHRFPQVVFDCCYQLCTLYSHVTSLFLIFLHMRFLLITIVHG